MYNTVKIALFQEINSKKCINIQRYSEKSKERRKRLPCVLLTLHHNNQAEGKLMRNCCALVFECFSLYYSLKKANGMT